jgi:hypothetical protein
MPYEYIASSANPRLLILLTDQSEESVKLVNYLIDRTIQINFDGNAPKNRCYISVIGYNHNVKQLCSGWLKDLDATPLRYEKLTKKVIKKSPDGAGGILEEKVDVEVTQPVWVESTQQPISIDKYDKAIHSAKEISRKWGEDNCISPIVIDCSKICYTDYAIEEIEQLKAVTTKDGNVLFFGCYLNIEDASGIFSKMPEEWEYRFKIWEIKEEDYSSGLLNYEHIDSIFSAIMEVGGTPAF